MCLKNTQFLHSLVGLDQLPRSYSKRSTLICDIMLVLVHEKSHLRAKYAARTTWRKCTALPKAHDSHVYVSLLLIIFVQHEAKLHNKKAVKAFWGRLSKAQGAGRCLA